MVSQRDEIALMRTWLRDRGQRVPDATSTRHRMVMNGMEHDMLMPGMLSDEEMAQLDKARGAEWDKLFLKFMIKHHEGALKMVEDLFATYGAAQGDDVYKLASRCGADGKTVADNFKTGVRHLNNHVNRIASSSSPTTAVLIVVRSSNVRSRSILPTSLRSVVCASCVIAKR